MNIASINNHPIQYGPYPSDKNFEMLGLEFEEFELISSLNELWILESREVVFSEDMINQIHDEVSQYYDSIFKECISEFDEGYLVIVNLKKRYGDFLLTYLNNDLNNIKLTKRYLYG